MLVSKMRQVITSYQVVLKAMPPVQASHDETPTPRQAASHAHWMLEQMEGFLGSYQTEEGSHEDWEKINRWLGFVQGVFWVLGFFVLRQMRDHSRSEE